ncbi:hypothetical protein FRC01_000217 [Tulasnella sp. 417]|nr:hypothetical protein FRC01_000217 [Tulasnella sp. 417]
MDKLKHEPVYGERRGGYCDVQVATLDSEIVGASKLVAAKKLFLGIRSSEPLRLAARLARELKVWAGLRHPHVLPLLGFYLDDDYGTALLISEFMMNGDLKDYITKMAPTYFERLHLVRDLTDGLAYLHAETNSVRHGDLKPGNVLVNPHCRAMLADFGLSKNLGTGHTGFTTGNDGRGTVRFSSPEILLEGAAAQSLANDIWSWGCLVLEAMTDEIPFSDIEHEPKLILALGKGETPCEAETLTLQLPQFSNLLVKCWTRQPNQRPKAADCLLAIQSALPTFWPANITQQMAEQRKRKQLATPAEDRNPKQQPLQRLSPQQTSRLRSNRPNPQSSPQVTQQPQPLPPKRPRQFQEFFAMAFKNWVNQRQLTLDTPNVDGKEVGLHELFFTVGALRGHRAVSEMSLWQFVGAKIGFSYSDGPSPYSKPEVADQLSNIYREVLADFEVHWHNSLRGLDPSSDFPLPPQLRHLRPKIEQLAAGHPTLRPFGVGSQQLPDDPRKGSTTDQITQQTLQLGETPGTTQQHRAALWNQPGVGSSRQPAGLVLPSRVGGPQLRAPVPSWKPIPPIAAFSAPVSSPSPAKPASEIPMADVSGSSRPESKRSSSKREHESDATSESESATRPTKRARTETQQDLDGKRNADTAAFKQLTMEGSLEKTIPSQAAPSPGVTSDEEEYGWWWDNGEDSPVTQKVDAAPTEPENGATEPTAVVPPTIESLLQILDKASVPSQDAPAPGGESEEVDDWPWAIDVSEWVTEDLAVEETPDIVPSVSSQGSTPNSAAAAPTVPKVAASVTDGPDFWASIGVPEGRYYSDDTDWKWEPKMEV